MKKKAVRMLRSIVLSYVITAVVLLLVCFIMYKFKLSMTGAGGAILFTYVISCLAGGFVFGGAVEEKRYLGGGLAGGMYFFVVYVVSAVWNHTASLPMPGMLTTFLICVFSGMLGGMIRAGMK